MPNEENKEEEMDQAPEDVSALKSAFERVKASRNDLRDENKKLKAEVDRFKAEQAEAEKLRREAEEKRLAEQGQFKELAEKAKAEVESLKPLKDELDSVKNALEKSNQTLSAYLESEIKALELDEATMELLQNKSAVEQLEWIAKHKKKLVERRRAYLPSMPSESNEAGKMSEEQRARAIQQIATRIFR